MARMPFLLTFPAVDVWVYALSASITTTIAATVAAAIVSTIAAAAIFIASVSASTCFALPFAFANK